LNRHLVAGAFALTALASGSAFSQSYAGFDLGISHATQGCGSAELEGTIQTCNRDHGAARLYGGYMLFGTPFAAEASYVDLGKFKSYSTNGYGEASGHYWGLGAAYRPKIITGLIGVVRAGAAFGTGKEKYSDGSTTSDTSKSQVHPYYGLGLSAEMIKNVDLTVNWDNTRMTTQISDTSSTSVVNTFSMGVALRF
jgi:hypothetical protein